MQTRGPSLYDAALDMGRKGAFASDGCATALLYQKATQEQYAQYKAIATSIYMSGGNKDELIRRLAWADLQWAMCPANPDNMRAYLKDEIGEAKVQSLGGRDDQR